MYFNLLKFKSYNQNLNYQRYNSVKSLSLWQKLFLKNETSPFLLVRNSLFQFRIHDSILTACYVKYSPNYILGLSANNIIYKYIIKESISFYTKQFFKFKFVLRQKNSVGLNNESTISYWLKNFYDNKNFSMAKVRPIVNKNIHIINVDYTFTVSNYYKQIILSNIFSLKIYSILNKINFNLYNKNNKYTKKTFFIKIIPDHNKNLMNFYRNRNILGKNSLNVYDKFIVQRLEKNYNSKLVNIYIKIKNNLNINLIPKFVTKDTINNNSVIKSDSEFEFTTLWYLKRKFNLYRRVMSYYNQKVSAYHGFPNMRAFMWSFNYNLFKLWLSVLYKNHCKAFHYSKKAKYDIIKKKFYITYTELYLGEKPAIYKHRKYINLVDLINDIIKKNGGVKDNCVENCYSTSSRNRAPILPYYSANSNLSSIYTFSDKIFEFIYLLENKVQLYFIKNPVLNNFSNYYNFINSNSFKNSNYSNIDYNNFNSILFITNIDSIKFGFFLDLFFNYFVIILFLYLFFYFFNSYCESTFSFALKIKNELVNNDSNLLDFKDSVFLSFLFFFNFVLIYNYLNSKFVIDFFFISFLYLNLMSLLSYFWLYDINIFIFVQGLFLKINIAYSLFKDSLTLFAFCVRLLLQFVRLIFCFSIVFIFQNLVEHFNDVLKIIYYYNIRNNSINDFFFFLKIIIEFLDSIINFVIQMTNYIVFSLWLIPYLFTFIKKKLKINNIKA